MRMNMQKCMGLMSPTVSTGKISLLTRDSTVLADEGQLISQLRAGEEEAFEAVVTRYQEVLIRMAMRYVANRATAEEVVQETWIAVMSGLSRFEGRSSFHVWICAILIHKAKDRGIRDKRQRALSGFKSGTNWNDEPDPSHFRPRGEWLGHTEFSRYLRDDQTPEKLLASRQAIACMWRAIENLPAHQKEVLILRDVQGIHTKEVCTQLNISETNFYVRLHRARERVKVAVEASLG